jgi:hypothetical protein
LDREEAASKKFLYPAKQAEAGENDHEAQEKCQRPLDPHEVEKGRFERQMH